jgi:phosphohistidine swiveling domain-containing protein
MRRVARRAGRLIAVFFSHWQNGALVLGSFIVALVVVLVVLLYQRGEQADQRAEKAEALIADTRARSTARINERNAVIAAKDEVIKEYAAISSALAGRPILVDQPPLPVVRVPAGPSITAQQPAPPTTPTTAPAPVPTTEAPRPAPTTSRPCPLVTLPLAGRCLGGTT